MKMKEEDFEYLKNKIEEFLQKHEFDLEKLKEDYREAGFSMKRLRWDLFHYARVRPGHSIGTPTEWNVYDYINNNHIDTALRKITNTK